MSEGINKANARCLKTAAGNSPKRGWSGPVVKKKPYGRSSTRKKLR